MFVEEQEQDCMQGVSCNNSYFQHYKLPTYYSSFR